MLSVETESNLCNLFLALSEGEKSVDINRQILVELDDYDPYQIFTYLDLQQKNHINSSDLLNFLQERGIQSNELEIKLIILFYDRDYDGVLSYPEFENFLQSECSQRGEISSNVQNDNNELSNFIDQALRQLLANEVELAKKILSLLEDLRQRYDFNIHDLYHAVKSWNCIEETSLKNFFERNKISYLESDISKIMKRLDFNGDGKIDLCEFHAFLGFPNCQFCCPNEACNVCGICCCDMCSSDIPCFMHNCVHENLNMDKNKNKIQDNNLGNNIFYQEEKENNLNLNNIQNNLEEEHLQPISIPKISKIRSKTPIIEPNNIEENFPVQIQEDQNENDIKNRAHFQNDSKINKNNLNFNFNKMENLNFQEDINQFSFECNERFPKSESSNSFIGPVSENLYLRPSPKRKYSPMKFFCDPCVPSTCIRKPSRKRNTYCSFIYRPEPCEKCIHRHCSFCHNKIETTTVFNNKSECKEIDTTCKICHNFPCSCCSICHSYPCKCCPSCHSIQCKCCPKCKNFPCKCCPICNQPECICCPNCRKYPCNCCPECHLELDHCCCCSICHRYPCICCPKCHSPNCRCCKVCNNYPCTCCQVCHFAKCICCQNCKSYPCKCCPDCHFVNCRCCITCGCYPCRCYEPRSNCCQMCGKVMHQNCQNCNMSCLSCQNCFLCQRCSNCNPCEKCPECNSAPCICCPYCHYDPCKYPGCCGKENIAMSLHALNLMNCPLHNVHTMKHNPGCPFAAKCLHESPKCAHPKENNNDKKNSKNNYSPNSSGQNVNFHNDNDNDNGPFNHTSHSFNNGPNNNNSSFNSRNDYINNSGQKRITYVYSESNSDNGPNNSFDNNDNYNQNSQNNNFGNNNGPNNGFPFNNGPYGKNNPNNNYDPNNPNNNMNKNGPYNNNPNYNGPNNNNQNGPYPNQNNQNQNPNDNNENQNPNENDDNDVCPLSPISSAYPPDNDGNDGENGKWVFCPKCNVYHRCPHPGCQHGCDIDPNKKATTHKCIHDENQNQDKYNNLNFIHDNSGNDGNPNSIKKSKSQKSLDKSQTGKDKKRGVFASTPYKEELEQFVEFLGFLMNVEGTIEDFKIELARREDFNFEDLFRIFEVDGKGYIEPEDLKQGLKLLGLDPSDFDIKLLMKRFDLNQQGLLTYSDFFDMVVSFEKRLRNTVQVRPPNSCCPCKSPDIFECDTLIQIKYLFKLIIDCEREINKRRANFDSLRSKFADVVQFLDYSRRGVINRSDLKLYLTQFNKYNTSKECDLLFIRLDKLRRGEVGIDQIEDELMFLR